MANRPPSPAMASDGARDDPLLDAKLGKRTQRTVQI